MWGIEMGGACKKNLARESEAWPGALWSCFRGQKECYLVPDYCCSSGFVLSLNQLLSLACSWHTSKRKNTPKNTLSFLLFPAEQPPPSSAWRPVALILIILCLVLLIGLAVLGFVCKSALWLGGGSWLQGLSRMRNICYEFFKFIFYF